MTADPHSLQSLREAVANPWPDRQVTVTKKVTKGSFGGISVEQCDMTLSGDTHTSTNWRSICFESHSVGKLEEMLQRLVKEQGPAMGIGEWFKAVPGSTVQGYPAFIMAASHDTQAMATNVVASAQN